MFSVLTPAKLKRSDVFEDQEAIGKVLGNNHKIISFFLLVGHRVDQ